MSSASTLVAQAKKWATYYGGFTTGPEGAALSAPLRVRAAWENNDADAFADAFAENGSMLVGDEQLTDREQIRAFLATAFAGPYRGARLSEEPLEVRLLSPGVALVITQGGIVYAGETEVSPEREVRALWVLVHTDGDWKVLSHQTSPLRS